MKKLNLNDIIKVKLTDAGKDIFYHKYDDLNKRIAESGSKHPIEPRFPDVDDEGYSRFQLWDFMWIYGKHMMLAAPAVIQPLNIYIEDEDLEDL
jgi:hypothetical protein